MNETSDKTETPFPVNVEWVSERVKPEVIKEVPEPEPKLELSPPEPVRPPPVAPVKYDKTLDVLIISYWADLENRYYSNHGKALQIQCAEFGLDADMHEIESLGSYSRNTKHKPVFIREKLREHKRPVCWIDCDSSILQPFEFPDMGEFDLMGVRRPLKAGGPEKDHYNIFASPLIFDYSDAVLEIIDNWIEECRAEKEHTRGDHPLLLNMLRRSRSARLIHLPLEFSSHKNWHNGRAFIETRLAPVHLVKSKEGCW